MQGPPGIASRGNRHGLRPKDTGYGSPIKIRSGGCITFQQHNTICPLIGTIFESEQCTKDFYRLRSLRRADSLDSCTILAMEAGVLICPQCGAAVSQDSTQCAHCHAVLQTVACPNCMGMMFVGTKFCPHCGTRAVAVEQGAGSARPCPRCHVALADVQVAKTPLEECTRCGGLWIDVSSFEFICSNAEARQAATGLAIVAPAPIDPKVIYLKCPQCQGLMNRMNYASRSGIIINVCRAHGVWLDRDEMRQIVQFISSGGLDHARQKEMEELQEARRAETAPIDDFESGVLTPGGLFRNSFNADERYQLLTGIASVANHFLGR
jgi:Zn-finger nucleic acid-binding protein/RNA polymerase subunit RPABC4/transcription elongation factor Spt4